MDAAIAALDGAEVDGRQIKVNRAQPQGGAGQDRPPDWPCPRCKASCFASRRECFKCGEQRPAGGRENDGEFDGAGGRNWRESARRTEEKQSATGDVSGVSGYNVQGSNSTRGRGGEKYNASMKRNMTKTVAEEAAEDDDSRMAAYLARKRAREQAR